MADGRITSGAGDGVVKTYTLDANRKITVEGVRVPGMAIAIHLEDPDGRTVNGPTIGTENWSQQIVASPGLHTLVVQVGRFQGKELRQQINVVSGGPVTQRLGNAG